MVDSAHKARCWPSIFDGRTSSTGHPQEEVLSHLAQSDLFLLACVIAKDSDRDGMPGATAKAMIMELPVISTNVVEIDKLVQLGGSYLVPSNGSVALAEAINSMQTLFYQE
jgi:colanic acid/amylovoran biosynthesis glycosyltransferase